MTVQYANKRLSAYFKTICETARDAHAKYLKSPHAVIHRPTTKANDFNDLWFAELVNALDQVDGIVPVFDRRKNLRFIRIPGRIPIHLWLKKIDNTYHSSNLQTRNARRLESGLQLEMFASAFILTLGYLINRDGTGIDRVSITPPCGKRKLKPEWAIDLTLSKNVANISVVAPSSVQVKITKFEQRKLGS